MGTSVCVPCVAILERFRVFSGILIKCLRFSVIFWLGLFNKTYNAESVGKGKVLVSEAFWFPFVVLTVLTSPVWSKLWLHAGKQLSVGQKASVEMQSRNPLAIV